MSFESKQAIHTIDDLQLAWLDARILGCFWYYEFVVMFVDSAGVPCRWRLALRRLPHEPTREVAELLVEKIGALAHKRFEGGSVAILTAMSGRGLADERELRWCRLLCRGLQEASFRSWPLIHAGRGYMGIVPPDALVA